MKTRILVLLLFTTLLGLAPFAQSVQETALFDIHHRPAQDLAPQIRTLLGKQGNVSVYGNQLIVHAPAERLEEIRWLISELDRAPRNLLVEVRVDRQRHLEKEAADIHLHEIQAWVRFHQYSTHGDGDILQQVYTLDGHPALIQIGQSVPVYQVEHSSNGSNSERVEVQYKDIHTGIYVLPRTHADKVTIEVYQQSESKAVGTAYFDTQQADTVVSGNLGEWIPIGAIDTTSHSHGAGPGYHAGTRLADQRYLSVRVTPSK